MRPCHHAVRCALLLGALPLAGCGDELSKAFGFTRNTPNEFTVTTRAPLTMPPSDALPSPEPGAPRPQEQGARQEALETIAPDVAIKGEGGTPTPGTDALLAEASQAAAAPRPRGGELRDRSGGIVNGLLFWHGKPAAMVVDAEAESHRLGAAAAGGEPPTEGATPIVDPR